jgi:hypothetical protein
MKRRRSELRAELKAMRKQAKAMRSGMCSHGDDVRRYPEAEAEAHRSDPPVKCEVCGLEKLRITMIETPGRHASAADVLKQVARSR